MKHYLIDSREVIKTNHQQYPIAVRTNCPEGKVILFLHGGPGLPDAELVRYYNSDIADTAVMVVWDQRGAGEAYSASFAFKKNLMKERMLNDIDNLVRYLCRRFNKQKVVLMAHGFGAVLSDWYTRQHPDKVDCLIQINPTITNQQTDSYGALKTLLPVIPDVLCGRRIAGIAKLIIGAKWSGNTPLAKEQFDLREAVKSLPVPVFMVTGTDAADAKEWFDILKAPAKEHIVFESCSGNPMFEKPDAFNRVVKRIMGR